MMELDMMELNEVLVPMDFSATSGVVFARSLEMVNGEDPVVIAHHVLDPSLAEFAESHGLGKKAEILAEMRARAERELEELRAKAPSGVEVQPLVSEGTPFYEIVRKAEEFAVDAVIMGKRGMRESPQSLFFGSTAERVVRGCGLPVIVLPVSGGNGG